MKRLYLLRHAHTEAPNHGTDRERALTDKGKIDAQNLGRTMTEKHYQPALILCSPAKRTRQTLGKIQNNVDVLKTDYPERLYGASCGDHVHFIQSTNDEIETLMIIAHNPGIYELVATLANEESVDKLRFGYAPGTLSVFECSSQSWADIQPGKNTLIDMIIP